MTDRDVEFRPIMQTLADSVFVVESPSLADQGANIAAPEGALSVGYADYDGEGRVLIAIHPPGGGEGLLLGLDVDAYIWLGRLLNESAALANVITNGQAN